MPTCRLKPPLPVAVLRKPGFASRVRPVNWLYSQNIVLDAGEAPISPTAVGRCGIGCCTNALTNVSKLEVIKIATVLSSLPQILRVAQHAGDALVREGTEDQHFSHS
jgi:hypothetical protein